MEPRTQSAPPAAESLVTYVNLVWADGEHRFHLKYPQLKELEDKVGCGTKALYRRIRSGDWKITDLGEVLRLGLIGGDMKPPDAYKLVQRYVYERPFEESVLPAQAVLMAVLFGVPAETGAPVPQAHMEPSGAEPVTASTDGGQAHGN